MKGKTSEYPRYWSQIAFDKLCPLFHTSYWGRSDGSEHTEPAIRRGRFSRFSMEKSTGLRGKTYITLKHILPCPMMTRPSRTKDRYAPFAHKDDGIVIPINAIRRPPIDSHVTYPLSQIPASVAAEAANLPSRPFAFTVRARHSTFSSKSQQIPLSVGFYGLSPQNQGGKSHKSLQGV